MKGFTLTQMLLPPAAAIIVVVAVLSQRRDNRQQVSVEKIHRLCLGSKMAMEDDARAFESGDPKKQEEAANRFYDGHEIYHSADSLLYCVDAKDLPPVNMCLVSRDWKCLANVARKIESKL